MIQEFLIKILLSPFSLLYGIGVGLRNFFYNTGLLRDVNFNIPIISIGNLSVGGAGKSPHVEYLVAFLRDYLEVATLSRGYKRKTTGFLTVNINDDAEKVGDEPLQFKRKFPDVLVAVGENRTFAIPKILGKNPKTQVIILDDAFQHRAVKPGLNILLTPYDNLFTKDFLLPSGRLREWRSAYKRAHTIIVSKCPPVLSEEEMSAVIKEIQPKSYQSVYFSYYDYLPPFYLFNQQYRVRLEEDIDVVLVSGIAGTNYLTDYLHTKVNSITPIEFEDHHYFSKSDIGNMQGTFERLDGKKKIILTTEKDAMRFELHKDHLLKSRIPIFVLPIKVRFHGDDNTKFNEEVKQFLLNFKA